MREMKVYAPTYYGDVAEAENAAKLEFDDSRVPVLIRPADGIRIILGTHDYFDMRAPDIQIERRPGGWAIFLHPLGGGDPCGCVYFLDDGRSFVLPENDLGTTPPIKSLSCDEMVPDIDRLKKRE